MLTGTLRPDFDPRRPCGRSWIRSPTLSKHRIGPPGCSISINLTLWQPGPRRDRSGLVAAIECSDARLSHDNCLGRRAERAVVNPGASRVLGAASTSWMSCSRILPVASLSSGATRSQRHAEADPTTRTGTVHCSCGLRRPPERDRATQRASPPTGSQASDHTRTSADPFASSARRALGPFAADPPPHAVNRLQDRRAETGRRPLTHRRLSGRLLSRDSARRSLALVNGRRLSLQGGALVRKNAHS